jgi:hypothetical protein
MAIRSMTMGAAMVLVVGCGGGTKPTGFTDIPATGGSTSIASGGSSGLMNDGDAGPSRTLGAHIERDQVEVGVVTLQCQGECADIEAVATGGNAPFTFAWEDGSTSASRHVCPTANTDYRVTVTDTGVGSGEFRQPASTAEASLRANVLDCSRPPDAGTAEPTGTVVYWTNWSVVTSGQPGSAEGTILAPSGNVQVTYGGELRPDSETQTGTSNVWNPITSYTSATVKNGPPNAGIIALSGAGELTQTITFSAPVRDPLVAVWSIGFGSLGIPATWEFDTPPAVLSVGPSATWPFGSKLTVTGNSVTGNEGNGVLQFFGTFTSLSFTVPTPEIAPGYSGFTVGIRSRG